MRALLEVLTGPDEKNIRHAEKIVGQKNLCVIADNFGVVTLFVIDNDAEILNLKMKLFQEKLLISFSLKEV